jgi:hypothetical protein
MVDLVLSAEQIRSAPREVKEWIKSIFLTELTLAAGPEHERGEMREATLAECTVAEAGLVLEQIRDDYLACQVFFELSRDSLREKMESAELHRIPVAEILRHTRLGDPEHLAACLDRISVAFQTVRHDPTAMLFAFDRMGNLYIHDATRRSIKGLWQALVTSRLINPSELPGIATPEGPTVPVDAGPAN